MLDLEAKHVSRLPGPSFSENSKILAILATQGPSEALTPASAPSWPLPCCATLQVAQGSVAMSLSPQDFLRCVTAALIYFAISITAVAKYSDGASKAAGVSSYPTPGRGIAKFPPPLLKPQIPLRRPISVWGTFCPCLGPWAFMWISAIPKSSYWRPTLPQAFKGYLLTNLIAPFPVANGRGLCLPIQAAYLSK